MKVLLAELDAEIQDQIHVGLEAFGDISADSARGVMALDRVRRCDYDCVFIGVGGGNDPGQELFERARDEHPELPIVIVANETSMRKFKGEKVRGKIAASLLTPLVPVEFYRMVGRLRSRTESPLAVS